MQSLSVGVKEIKYHTHAFKVFVCMEIDRWHQNNELSSLFVCVELTNIVIKINIGIMKNLQSNII